MTMNKNKIKAAADFSGEVIHAVSVPVKSADFSGIAYSGGTIRQIWADYPLVINLASLRICPQVPLLFNHQNDPEFRLGATECVNNGTQIAITGRINAKTRYAQCIVDGKDIDWQLSVGLTPNKIRTLEAGQEEIINNQQFAGPLYIVEDGELFEISVVAVGADDETHLRIAAGYANKNPQTKGGNMNPKLQEFIRARYSLAETADVAAIKAHLETINRTVEQEEQDFNAKQSVPDVSPELQQTVTAAATLAARKIADAERERVKAINELFGDEFPEVRAAAISEGIDLNSAKDRLLSAIRSARPTAGGVNVNARSNQGTDQDRVILAAALLTTGLPGEQVIRATSEQTVDQAQRQYRSGIGLQQMLLLAARANGFTGLSVRGYEREVLQAAFSTMSLPGIFSAVVNKHLLSAFMAVESVYEEISASRSVSDFREITSYRMNGNMEFEEVSPGGELKSGELGEEAFGNRAKTYGKLFSITREDIINDDLGAMVQIPAFIGRGAKLKLNKVFWTEFLKSAFYSTANENLLTGASSALSIDSLTAAEKKFLEKVDDYGNPLAFTPHVLLVPPALKVTAERLYKDTTIENAESKKSSTTGNPHAGKFRPVCSAYLSNANIPGSSSTAWYLLANPADIPAIEICYLNGNRTPVIESAQADFENLGVKFRGYWDFGVRQQDPRAVLKNTGAA